MGNQLDQDDDIDKKAVVSVGEPRQVQPAAASRLTREEFQGLADVPPEVEWFANIRNKNTKRAYGHDVKEFARFVGVSRPEDFRLVTRAHIMPGEPSSKRRSSRHQPSAENSPPSPPFLISSAKPMPSLTIRCMASSVRPRVRMKARPLPSAMAKWYGS